jgi:YbbR domain-containing protein
MKLQSVPLAIAALFLSIMLWLGNYPQNIPDQQIRPLRAKLSYQGLPEDLVITEMPETVSITARGSSERLKQIDPAELEAVASFDSTTQPGKRRVVVTIVPPKYKEFFQDRDYATFTIERIATRKLPVEVETVGKLKDPLLALDDTLQDPAMITASGPESVIKNLAKARALLDLSEISWANKDAQYVGIEPVLANNTVPENVTLDPKVVKVTPLVSSSTQQKTIGLSAQLTGGPPAGYMMAGYEIAPPLVTIRGTSRAIAGITSISTEPINLNGVTKSAEYEVNLQVPQGIAVTGSRKVRVKVMINPVSAPSTPESTTGQ